MNEWSPAPERSYMFTWIAALENLGQALSYSVGGSLDDIHKRPMDEWDRFNGICETGVSTTWSLNYYVAGFAGLVAGLSFLAIVSNTPDEMEGSYISAEELRYCRRYCKVDANTFTEKVTVTKSAEAPILAMLTNKAAWATGTLHFCFAWGVNVLLFYLPTYLEEYYQEGTELAGQLVAVSQLVAMAIGLATGLVADWLISTRLTVRQTRISVMAVCVCLFSAGMLVPFYVEDRMVGTGFALLALAVVPMAQAGYGANYADICPHYTLVLLSIFNSFANLSSPLSIFVEGNILGAHSFSVDQNWERAACLSVGIFFLGFLVYAGFMEGHPIQDIN